MAHCEACLRMPNGTTPTPRIAIRLASDGLAAFVSVSAGAPLEPSELDEALRRAGVTSGLLAETCALVAARLPSPIFACEPTLVAAGRCAQPGQDARLELEFSEGLQPGHLREDGSVDYHDRELLKPVARHDVIARVHPAEPGSAGLKVDGSPIPPPPLRDLPVLLGPGVALGPDHAVRAVRDGVVLYRPGHSLDVVDHHVHAGPVDARSGNLCMQGSLVVQGDVLRPFSVVASGDVEIRGSIEAASVRAGGRLSVRGRVLGADDCAVTAEGECIARHAEAASLHCAGVLRLADAVNCELCAESVHIAGRVRGGSATAEQCVTAKEAGSASGVDTRLRAAMVLTSPVFEARRAIAFGKAERFASRAGGRSADRNKGGKLGRVRVELEARELRRLADGAKRRQALLDAAFVEVGVAHPGVVIQIGDAQLSVDELTRNTRYSFDRGSARVRADKCLPAQARDSHGRHPP
ncbi:MAG: DUF342 domain-containing protein [Polyangiaceae bacterium]|nr:DUF342 domain-containing protein [Polyangiaceae bacterium]